MPEEVLQRCIKTSKACRSFQVVRGVALGLFACFDAGKCKWIAVRCSLLDKAKRAMSRCKSLRTRVYEVLEILLNKDRVDGRYARRVSLTGKVLWGEERLISPPLERLRSALQD